jgi:predicted MFS family arabinose efflux permease
MFSVLRQRSFALLWVGGLISIAGDWVLYAALPFFVYERTGSTVATAGMIAAELAPGVFVGSFAGVYVDRLDRRRLLVATNLLQALTIASLLAVSTGGRLWIVYAVAAAQSVIASFALPAESALLPSLVADRDLVAANALTTLNNRLGRLLGVPLGGLLLGMFGLTPVIVADAISFLLAAGLVVLVRAPRRTVVRCEGSVWASFGGEWADGLRLVRDDRTVAMLFWVLGLMTFGGTMLDPLYVAWVRDVLDRGPQVYGLLLMTHALAGIAGALLVARYRANLAPRFLMGWSSVLAGLALVAKFDLPFVALTFALTMIGGVCSVASSIGVETWVQQAVRDEFRGRVFAALGASGGLFSLSGALVGGVAAGYVGVTAMLNVAAALVTAAGLVVFRALRPVARGAGPGRPRQTSLSR